VRKQNRKAMKEISGRGRRFRRKRDDRTKSLQRLCLSAWMPFSKYSIGKVVN
jgi:hypothetical protein